jgi:hypothetical protein
MKIEPFLLISILVSALAWPTIHANADAPSCTFLSDGNITCTAGGAAGDGKAGSTPKPGLPACSPGATVWVERFAPDMSGTCSTYSTLIDQCTGSILDIGDNLRQGVACPQAPAPQASHPCTTFSVNAGGISCDANHGWHVVARVRFPETFLDVRPYPATLVRWPTALRNGGQPSSSSSGNQGYYGTGSPGSPVVGDWSNIRLTLTLNPASTMFVTLPDVGALSLSDQGANGTPQIIQWEVPSHPDVGGKTRAATVSGLDELPGDMPLFVGSGRSAYRLFWNLSYNQYEAINGCVPGANSAGQYNCGGGTGHRGVVGHDWRQHSSGGEIPPSAVAGLPASVAADLNGDGMAEAYWDRNLTLRRMDDANSIDNPTYRRSWNWGGLIYWAVREGQGQIGWPGGQ